MLIKNINFSVIILLMTLMGLVSAVLKCYKATNLETSNMGFNCSAVKGLGKVDCDDNAKGCFGYLNSKGKLDFGCGNPDKCEKLKNCCDTDFCNCRDQKDEL
jgi:hypothetical protein